MTQQGISVQVGGDDYVPLLPLIENDSYSDSLPNIRGFKKRKESRAIVPPKMDALQGKDCWGVEDTVFDVFKNEEDKVHVAKFLGALKFHGLRKDDFRLRPMIRLFHVMDNARAVVGETHGLQTLYLNRADFTKCLGPSLVTVNNALQNQMVVPDFNVFCEKIEEIYQECKGIEGGKPAQYIPQLARVSPNHWAVAICTVDGQRHTFGDAATPFCFQSVCKAFNYAIALGEYGTDYVHEHVGQEPSGRAFNQKGKHMSERFDWVMDKFQRLAGGEHIGFSNQTFLSERDTADRNFALAYYLQENKVFPENAKLQDTLDLYFQLCSMEVSCDSLAVMAATLANGGICPMTGEAVVSNRACRDTLSLMYSCGMYDYSGQFAFHVGLPAKSGVSGDMILVIPNQMGIALWSPPLDSTGNTVRGVEFSKRLVAKFNFHNYDNVNHSDVQKQDPRKQHREIWNQRVVHILFAAKAGDLNAITQYHLQGPLSAHPQLEFSPGMDMELEDYDGRTALHVAAAEGHLPIVKFLHQRCRVSPSPKDRWGNTPSHDAKTFNHTGVHDYLQYWLNAIDNSID